MITDRDIETFKKVLDNFNKLEKSKKLDVEAAFINNHSFVRLGAPNSRKFEVDEIKRYDVLYTSAGAIIPHHQVVFKIEGNKVYCLSITSKETSFSDLFKITKNRVFSDGYFTTTISIIDLELAKKSFVFVYSEGRREFDEFITEMKEFYNKLLK